LEDVVPRCAAQPAVQTLLDALHAGRRVAVDGAWGSACALLAATLARNFAAAQSGTRPSASSPGTIVIVLPRLNEVDDFAVDFRAFGGMVPSVFPAWEAAPRDGEGSLRDPILAGRTRLVRELLVGGDVAIPSTGAGGGGKPVASTSHAAKASGAAKSGAGPLARMRGAAKKSVAVKSGAGESEASDATFVALPRVVVTCLPALLHPVPSAADLRDCTIRLSVGQSIAPQTLVDWIVARGCAPVPAIEMPGEFSLRGGILDVFSPSETEPLRIEFFGDEIESLRRFDAGTQRRTEELREVHLTLVGEPESLDNESDSAASPDSAAALAERRSRLEILRGGQGEHSFLDILPEGSWVVLHELADLVEEGKRYLDRLGNPRGFFSVPALLSRVDRFPGATLSALGGGDGEIRLSVESIERFQSPHDRLVEELQQVTARDEHVLIACHNAGELQRLTEMLAKTDLVSTGRVQLCEGQLLKGFRLVSEKLCLLSDHELFGRRDIRRVTERRSKLEGRAIDSFLELNPGDLVVHLAKGIARYHGMKVLRKDEQEEEHLALEFDGGAMVYVPVSLIHLVQKYVGGAKASPKLSPLTGGAWERKKQKAAESVLDLASDMIRLQAARAGCPGLTFPPDTKWQHEFEDAFPYTATDDQVVAVAQIKEDMERPRPMDRLICGDVGYGKTEVAMRAAFKAVDAGKQVAVLVPTTVLAEQHYRTFTERMAEYPFRIEVLSRFRTKSEQKEVLEGLACGSVDIVIGTHRLVQSDIKFHDLGMLVIDEEQRFGVDAKDRLKRLRLEVDVLTLSATPIPRTLHLSLVGVRDISNLMTPPHDRQPVETRICRFDGELIRHAIVRELNRGGQVYFVHNRVYNIEEIAETLRQIVPEARIGIGHGQMGGDELEDVMVSFVNGQLDILVATTIIESGLDIPNANTIFINDANNYGLADLHQLRGRVGRYKHRAYCYLMLAPGLSLTGNAAKRLKAIEEFKELGSGFKIAMRDLEIRGAGNILGTEQSGHIASVGYELYCQLLENAGRQLRNLPVQETVHVSVDLPLAAFLPDEYVPPGRPKIEMYRRLSRAENLEQLRDMEKEMADRFGVPPAPVVHLCELRHLQILAREWGIDDIHLEEEATSRMEAGFAVLRYRDARKMQTLVKRHGSRLRIVDGKHAYLVLASPLPPVDRIVLTLKALLQPENSPAYSPAPSSAARPDSPRSQRLA
jgi:transcription-repair coupling factor (superfamily II helicase)